jgi:hypothetical protein
MMDSGTATVEINGAMLQFHISNMYSVSGVERPRAGVGINATCNMNISNFYSHNSANFPDFLLTSPDAKLTLTNFRSVFYPNATRWAEVRLGFLRFTNGYLSLAGPRTVAAIAETAGGILSVDNVLVQGSTASGPLISVVTDTSLSMIGRVSVEAGSAWTYSLPAGLSQDFYSPVTLFHGGRVFADGFFAGGVLQVGDPAGMSATVALMGAAGTTRQLVVSRGANPAWSVVIGVGDNFLINRYDDAGAPVDTPLDINRATGLITALRLQAVTFGMNTGPVARQTVTGSRGGNAALASFLTAMAAFGFITDSTTA